MRPYLGHGQCDAIIGTSVVMPNLPSFTIQRKIDINDTYNNAFVSLHGSEISISG